MTTVDDLLERIDDAVERAKIIVEDGKTKAATMINEGQTTAASAANASQTKPEEEPIRINYGDIHKLEDLLKLVNDQPGHRKVVLEGAPGQSNIVSVRTSNNPAKNTENTTETSSTTKKTTETPSSLNTTVTKTTKEQSASGDDRSSSQSDHIHVNVENLRSVEDLLDRIDDAVQHVPVFIDFTPQEKDKSGLFFI